MRSRTHAIVQFAMVTRVAVPAYEVLGDSDKRAICKLPKQCACRTTCLTAVLSS